MSKQTALWAIGALAVVVRLVSAILQGNHVEALPGVADQLSYHNLAIRVIQGHGLTFPVGWWPATAAGAPTAHWSYLYVLFLSLAYWVWGPEPLAARVIQALAAGVLQTVLSFRIGARLFGWRVGYTTAALAAVNVYFAYYAGTLMTESFYIVAMLWVVDLCTQMAEYGAEPAPRRKWIALGLALAAAVLLRQLTLLLVPFILFWIGRRSFSDMAATAKRVAVTLLVLAGCILPWTARNYRAFGSFVLLNTNAGFAFYWGNHPIHGSEFMPLIPTDKPSYGELIPNELRTLNEADMDRALMRLGLGFVAADPARYVRLSLSRAREYFRIWPSSYSGSASNYARMLSAGIIVPLILVGIALVLLKPAPTEDGEQSPSSIRFVLGVCGLYSLIHLLSWTLIRYRLPADAVALPFAAVALVCAYDRVKLLRRTETPRSGITNVPSEGA